MGGGWDEGSAVWEVGGVRGVQCGRWARRGECSVGGGWGEGSAVWEVAGVKAVQRGRWAG